MILKTFGIDIPLVKPFFAIILIYIGIMLIVGFNKSSQPYVTTPFHQTTTERSIVFGAETISLSSFKNLHMPTTITLNVVFGKGKLILDPSIATTIKINSAFSNVQLPEETIVVLGSNTFKNHGPEKESQITILANVVFGNLVVV
ncbi:MAG TPA: hypothetical protein VFF04_00455 [Candidatus Babeliales bacterium]|nr:hypothetical protein [Candidatus Babeliales bacterium]